jgi:hypothetical protein
MALLLGLSQKKNSIFGLTFITTWTMKIETYVLGIVTLMFTYVHSYLLFWLYKTEEKTIAASLFVPMLVAVCILVVTTYKSYKDGYTTPNT